MLIRQLGNVELKLFRFVDPLDYAFDKSLRFFFGQGFPPEHGIYRPCNQQQGGSEFWASESMQKR